MLKKLLKQAKKCLKFSEERIKSFISFLIVEFPEYSKLLTVHFLAYFLAFYTKDSP